MMYRSLFPRDLFAEFDRLQRDLMQNVEPSPAIRGAGRGGYPALNVGSTPQAVEVYAFAPGIDPATLEVDLDRGVLTIAGERKAPLANGQTQGTSADSRQTVHLEERFSGRFRRVVSLPDDIDPTAVRAEARDGVLHVTIPRKAAPQPRRIDIA